MYPSCVCGAKDYKKILSDVFNNRKFQIIRCRKCGLARTLPIPDAAENIKFYETQKNYSERINQLSLWQKFAKKILEALKKYKKSGRLLDVGCNIGVFVDLSRRNSYDAFGLDPSLRTIEAGKKIFNLENRLSRGKLKDLNFTDNEFDIITYLHVLEHIPDLREELREIYRVLKKEGLLLIEAPNFNSLWRKLLGVKWYALSPSQHIWQFSAAPLKKLLEEQNFLCLKIETDYSMYHKITPDFKGLVKLIIAILARAFSINDDLIIIAKKI